MGLLDRLRTTQPSTKPRGESGRGHVDGFLALEELNNDLRGRAGFTVFDRMYRTDPDVRRNVAMVVNPIVGGTWSVEPYGGDQAEEKDLEVAEFVEKVLMQLMRPTLPRHLAQLMPVLIRSGFTPFEQVWTSAEVDGKTRLIPQTLGMRLPRTIAQFHQDDAGELTDIVQWTPRGGSITMPADDLVYYRLGAEGDNWEGTSLLRPVYKPWLLKDQIERLAAIKMEREATGVPIAYPPANVDDQVLDDVEASLGAIRTNEQGYIVSPGPHAQYAEKGQGWVFDILTAKSSESYDPEKLLNYFSGKIAASFIAEFMRLGQENVGARATADVQQDPFLAGVEAIAGEVEATLNEQFVRRLVELNFEVDEPPKLRMSLVDSTSLEQLAKYVSDLVAADAFHPDDDLEDFLREKADLPPANAEQREARKEAGEAAREALKQAGNQPPGNQPPPKPGDPPAPTPPRAPSPAPQPEPPAPQKTERDEPLRWGRELRWWEEKLSLEVIDSAITGARERLQQSGGAPAREIAKDFASAALSGKGKMPKPGGALAETFSAELDQLYRVGRSTVAAELEMQKPEPGEPAGFALDEDTARQLARRGKLAAESIAARIWQAVSRSTLQKPGDVAAAQAAGEAEAAAALRAEAILHASAALNAGRTDAAADLSDEIAGSRYTSILDRNRCAACRAADDDILRPLNDPVRLARIPPNANCYGGDRCRCIEFFEYDSEIGGGGSPPPPAVNPLPTSPAVAQHFDVTGGNASLRQVVADQLAAIEAVHRMPASMPRIPITLARLYTATKERYGVFSRTPLAASKTIVNPKIKLSVEALGSSPPITSAVHEIGHFLDQFGFGLGVPEEMFTARQMASETAALADWRDAALKSNAFRQLVANGGDSYVTSIREVLARSYEQWIATRSGNQVLWDKIARRQQDNPNLYWSASDFEPIAGAYDRLFSALGLR